MNMNELSPDMTRSYPSIYRQRGFSLIEALVAFLILSVGMLGIASLQTVSLRAGATATLRSAATIKAEEIVERIRANHKGLIKYISGTGDDLTAPANLCQAASDNCTETDMAKLDKYQWKQGILAVFPATTTATIAMVPGIADPTANTQQVTVAINWKERDPSNNGTINMTYSTTQDMCGGASC